MKRTRSIDSAPASRPAFGLSGNSVGSVAPTAGEINDQVAALDARISEVSDLADSLVTRINPVLRPLDAVGKCDGDSASGANTELGRRLECLDGRLETLRNFLRDAHLRLALP